MTTATHLIRAAILILALSLAGCSGGGANDPAQQPTEFLITNWSRIDWGRRLRLWTGPAGESGHQFSTPIGRLDLLCEDVDSGALVVIELKRGLPSDRVVGQTARYMGWVGEHLADGRDVHGIIVAHQVDDRLRYAVRPIAGLSMLVYEISFALRSPTA
jgi:hypothetical protein